MQIASWAVGLKLELDERRRCVAMVCRLLALVAEVAQTKRYGSFGVRFTAEAGRIAVWREECDTTNK